MIILNKTFFIQCEKYLDAAICFVVFLVHAIVLSAMFGRNAPQLDIGVPAMQLVSLGDLAMGKANLPVEPVPPTSYEPEPEPTIKQSDEILTVTSETNADIAEKPKQKIVKKQKPIKSTKNKKQSIKKPAAKTLSNNEKKGSSNGSTSVASTQIGKGTGESIATHLGNTLNNPRPPYPPLSIERGETGQVRLQVVVETDGRPSLVKLVKSSGYPRLDRSALKTVREKYRFKPASRLGIPIKSDYTFTITFDLNQMQ